MCHGHPARALERLADNAPLVRLYLNTHGEKRFAAVLPVRPGGPFDFLAGLHDHFGLYASTGMESQAGPVGLAVPEGGLLSEGPVGMPAGEETVQLPVDNLGLRLHGAIRVPLRSQAVGHPVFERFADLV